MHITTEGEINEILIKATKLYLKYNKEGRPELALQVLAVGSKVAEYLLNVTGIERVYHTWCPTCGVKHTNQLQRHWIHTTGECLSCNHARSDTLEY